MEPDRVLEVPDMADRLARPYCHASSSQQNTEHPSERYACQQTEPSGKNITVSKSSTDGTEKIFRYTESSRSLPDALDAEYHESSSLSRRPRIGHTGVSPDKRESMEAVDCQSKHLNMSHLTRCKNLKGNLGLEQVSEDNESLAYKRSSEFYSKSSPAKSPKHAEIGSMVNISQTEKMVLKDKDNSHNFRVKRKSIDFCYDSQPKLGLAMSRALPLDMSQGPVRQKRLVENGDASPCTVEKNMMHSEFHCQQAIIPPNEGIVSDQCNQEEVGLLEAESRIKQRRLKQGEYTKNENADYNKKLKEDKIEDMLCKEMPDVPSTASSETENIGLGCCGRYEVAKKEKASANDCMINEPHSKYVSQLVRPYTRAEDRMTIIGQSQSNANIQTVGNPGWRRMHNRNGKLSIVSSSEAISIHKIEASHKQGAISSLNNAVGNSEAISVSELKLISKQSESMLEFKSRSKGSNKGRRKNSLIFDSHGKNASSLFNDPEVLYLVTSQRTSTSISTRNQTHQRCNALLDTIIEVDKLHSPDATLSAPPEQSPQTDVSRARIRQIESDELFAHELQEQMLNESQEIGIREEIDAALALSLQQEEHVQSISSDSRDYQHNARNRLGTQLHSQVSSRNYAMGSSPTKYAKLVKGINFRRMSMNTKLDVLEEFDAAFDNDDTTAISHIHQPVHHRNFNELPSWFRNEYEMLLLPDDNNHQPSNASEIEINTLPQSVVQTDNAEICDICLDEFSIGDIIRHLPCLHKFHKVCIDKWLRQKTSCPKCNLKDFLATSPRLS